MDSPEFGIGVTLVAPGRVETPFWDGYGSLPPGRLPTAGRPLAPKSEDPTPH